MKIVVEITDNIGVRTQWGFFVGVPVEIFNERAAVAADSQ